MPSAYGGVTSRGQVPANAPPHTIRKYTDKGQTFWRWGEIDDIHFREILTHELGHRFDPCFEHNPCHHGMKADLIKVGV